MLFQVVSCGFGHLFLGLFLIQVFGRFFLLGAGCSKFKFTSEQPLLGEDAFSQLTKINFVRKGEPASFLRR